EVSPLLAGPYRTNLLRLNLSGHIGLAGVADLAETPLPRLHWLQLEHLSNPAHLEPLFQTSNLPNLTTLRLPELGGQPNETLARLATAAGLPHLSLVTTRRNYWILGGGQAQPVANGVWPEWCDWAEVGPYHQWEGTARG